MKVSVLSKAMRMERRSNLGDLADIANDGDDGDEEMLQRPANNCSLGELLCRFSSEKPAKIRNRGDERGG
ncbi:hypothetical protein M0R45_016413 [Rubus argutus]|uniref:Uncharacterized protein n=1 Tax=Rubus argutus TaxID=59490 RepID=A0AAW1XTB0_RUBAR